MEVMKLNLEGDPRHEEQLGDETDDIHSFFYIRIYFIRISRLKLTKF